MTPQRVFVAPPPAHERVQRAGIPTFSIVITTYQAAATAGEAVESALNQTVSPLEVIVCDDGSTDDIEGAIAAYRDDILFLRTAHGGAAWAFNHGLRTAVGDFVLRLDSDDTLLPDCLAVLGELASARPDLDLLSTDVYLEVDGEVVGRFYDETPFALDDQRVAILQACFVGWPAARRSHLLAVGGFDESLAVGSDWDAWLRLILRGSRAGLVLEALRRYRLRHGSLSGNRSRSLRARVLLLDKARSNPDLQPEERPRLESARRAAESRARQAEAYEALIERRADARRRSLALARAPTAAWRARITGAAAAVLPQLAGYVLRRRSANTPTLVDHHRWSRAAADRRRIT